MYGHVYKWLRENYIYLFWVTIAFFCCVILLSDFLERKKVRRFVWLVMLIVYLLILFFVTLGFRETAQVEHVILNVYSTLTDTIKRALVGIAGDDTMNLLLFIPIGMFCCELGRVGIRLLLCVGASSLTSIIIECVQLHTKRGYFDVNDLINNIAGGVLGYLIYMAVMKVSKYSPKCRSGH